MKRFLLITLCATIAICVASQHVVRSEQSFVDEFETFKSRHKKIYDPREHHYRFRVFSENLKKIDAHNSDTTKSYKLGLNENADLTTDEFKARFLGYKYQDRPIDAPARSTHKRYSSGPQELPADVDWRKKNAVTEVKDQGQCGSCWSFSATGAIEGAHAIDKGGLVSLSEKNLVDCSSSFGNMGCNGGLMQMAFEYVIANKGIDKEDCYPYKPVDGSCSFDKGCIGAKISKYANITQGSEDDLADAVANHGPVAVAINAGLFSFQLYSGGIYFEKSCGGSEYDLDHGVLLVGYGSEGPGKDYWIVKNSWGKIWGEQGYIRMARNKNNMCGIATDASYPIV